ncbi:MAG: hypothetical protein WCO33_05035 [bacterium]
MDNVTVQPEVKQEIPVKYVKCDYCSKDIIAKHSNDLFGFHLFKCSNCGKNTKYPMSTNYVQIYIIVIILVLLGLTQSTFCIILAIVFAFPLIEHFSMKGKHPMYKFEEENSEKTFKESQSKTN